MSAPLRPMTLGEILDRTFQIYRARFMRFAVISALPSGIIMVVYLANFLWWKLSAPFSPLRFLGIGISTLAYVLITYHVSFFAHLCAWPNLVRTTVDLIGGDGEMRQTRQLSPLRLFGITSSIWSVVLLVPELIAILLWIGVTALASEALNFSSDTMDAIIMPITVVFTIAAWSASLWLSSIYMIGVPAYVMESLPIRKSLKRGRALSVGARWKVVLTRFALGLAGYITSVLIVRFIIFCAMMLLFRGAYWLNLQMYLVQVLGIILGALAAALLGPIYPIALTLLYYDQRIRREGLDIEWSMRAAGMELPQAVTAPAGGETA